MSKDNIREHFGTQHNRLFLFETYMWRPTPFRPRIMSADAFGGVYDLKQFVFYTSIRQCSPAGEH